MAAALGALLALTQGLACTTPAPPPRRPRPGVMPAPAVAAPVPLRLDGPPGLPAKIVAELASDQTEIYVARRGSVGLVVAPLDGQWHTAPFGGDAPVPRVAPGAEGLRAVAPAPEEEGPVAVAAHGDGYLLVWSVPRSDGGEHIVGLALDARGAPQGEPKTLATTTAPVSWVGLLGSDASLVAWDVRAGDVGDVYVAPWPRGGPKAAARGVLGWDADSHAGGATIAYVGGGSADRGKVGLVEIAADGTLGTPVEVTASATAWPDVQLARLLDDKGESTSHLLAWTDDRDVDPHVYTASVVGSSVRRAGPALAPVGSQALIDLVPAGDARSALLVWEPMRVHGTSGRQLELRTLAADGAARDDHGLLEYGALDGAPHLAPDGTGFAALTLAAMRPAGGEGGPTAPVYVRLGADLHTRAAEPIRVLPFANAHGAALAPGLPLLTSGLRCGETFDAARPPTCTLIATGPGAPSHLALVELPARTGGWASPATALPAAEPPLARRLAALGDQDGPVAAMSSAPLADGRTLLAWLTLGQPGAGGDPALATLAYRFLDNDGTPGPVLTLSRQAVSVGGVRVIAADPSTPGRAPAAVVGWVAMDRGSPQITLTNLAGDGSKLLERPITAVRRVSKGELTSEVASVDLALAPDGGYHLAFVDSRDGKADVYAARVNPRLAKTVAERRVSDTAGGAGEPRILAQGDRVLVVWSDTPPATAGSTPHGDLRAAVLRARDLVAQVPDKVLFASPAHSRTPNLSSFDGGVLVSWVEEADPSGPQGQGPDAAGARLLAIDGDAVPLASARLATLPGAPITSAAIACRPRHGCRLVVAAVGTQRTLHLAGLDLADPLSGPTQLRVKVLATLPHGTAQDVLLGAGDAAAGSAFFVEDAVGGRGARLRRLDVSW